MDKDFLAISDFSADEIMDMLDLAIELKKERTERGQNPPILKGKVLAMIFQKPSLRTRVSFDMAMRHLGGDALYLSPNEIGLGQRESIADISRVMSGYVDAVMARVFDHQHILDLAKYSSIPVINGLSDYNHPCQAMADMLTIKEHFKNVKNLNVAFIGDGNNVAVSLMHICAKLGANFAIASPEGYGLNEGAIKFAKTISSDSGSKLVFSHNINKVVQNADVLYTDTWISMGQEEETNKREKAFIGYQINESLVAIANKNAIVLHCLPAHRGQEITDEVADGNHSAIFQQAHNRLHAQKAILVRLLGK
jgi:ornithine carbamoyltransferase